MTDSALVELKLQQLQNGATPVPIVKELFTIAESLSVPPDSLVDFDQLRFLCIQSLQYSLQPYAEGAAINESIPDAGTFYARFRAQVVPLQRLLGDHEDFTTFLKRVEQVAHEVFYLR